MTERQYIRYRKTKAFLNSICFYVCRVFPIDAKLVTVCTFEGRGGFGCNPKYIIQKMHELDPSYKYVWLVNDINKQFPDYIKPIKNSLWNRAFWLTRSAVWIDNYRKPYGTIKRRKQLYINTWHATQGFKSIGLWRGKAFSKIAYLVSKNDSDMVDYFITDSEWCDEVNPKGMLYDGPNFRFGAPRCDALYGDRTKYKANLKKKHGLPEDCKVVMFAPTFREGAKDGKRSVFSEVWSIDFQKLLNNLQKRFGGDWYLCLRVHPQLADSFDGLNNNDLNNHIIDESKADDMYEILAGVDAFVTDYSSAAMDACLTQMPVFIYADDISSYTKDRGSLLWNLSEDTEREVENNKTMTPKLDLVLPFSVSKNNDELENRILNFQEEEYKRRLKEYEEKVELVFDGNASEKTAKMILGNSKNRK